MQTQESDGSDAGPLATALRRSTELIGGQYVWRETALHPQLLGPNYRLAVTLCAYSVGTEPDPSSDPRVTVAEQPTAPRLLLVDDAPDVLVTVGAFLVSAGFDVIRALNGDEALRLVAADPGIAMLITDYAMPGLSGVDLTAQAMQLRPRLAAIVITAYPGAAGLAALPGRVAVLSKPFRRAALLLQVNALLGGEQPQPPAIEVSGQPDSEATHELNNVLQTLTFSLDLLGDELADHPVAREQLDIALRSMRRAAELSRHLLARSRAAVAALS
jgi:CheY-like chemotaxis protein